MKRSHARMSVGNGPRRMARRWTPSLRRGAISLSAAGAFATVQAVGDDADVVAAIGLAVGEVQDVTEDSTDRRAHRVQDTKRLIGSRGHDQNEHSPTSTVSVGAAIPRNINFD